MTSPRIARAWLACACVAALSACAPSAYKPIEFGSTEKSAEEAGPIGGASLDQRRENMKRSADELKVQLDAAKDAMADAFEELKKVEQLDERDQMRERAAEEAQERAELDSIGLLRSRTSAPLI